MHQQRAIRTLLFLVLAGLAPAQQTLQPTVAPSPLRDAGIYHVATGTWTRQGAQTASLGPDVIYANDAPSGYFHTLGMQQASEDWSAIDEGRIPSIGSSIANTDRTSYQINALQFSYCTTIIGPNVGITFTLYESYAPCNLLSAPLNPVVVSGSLTGMGLPGANMLSSACWTVTLDISGYGEFCLEGDGGSAFPGEDLDLDQDSFGIEWKFHDAFGTETGPYLAGDPSWTVATPGSITGIGGGGTYYNSNAAACGVNTGLETLDLFAIDGDGAGVGPGCYFFGGYINTNGCGQPSFRSYGSFHTVIYASTVECIADCTSFCPPLPNSTGQPVTLRCTQSSTAATGWRLDASGGPPNQFGYLLVSAKNTNSILFADGILCLGGFNAPIYRYNAISGTDNSTGRFDAQGNFVRVACGSCTTPGFDIPTALPLPAMGNITPGSTWHFQLWYRDGTAVNNESNLSNGISVDF